MSWKNLNKKLMFALCSTVSIFMIYSLNNTVNVNKQTKTIASKHNLSKYILKNERTNLKESVLINSSRKSYFSPENNVFPDLCKNMTSKEKLEYALTQSQNRLYVLYWYKPFGKIQNRSVDQNTCGNCEITFDRKLITHSATKAIIFHYDQMSVRTLPVIRNPDQYYVFYSKESSLRIKQDYDQKQESWDNIFNLTMTHRRDSDIYSPYGTVESSYEFLKPRITEIDQLIRTKKNLVIWIVSNCGANARNKYVQMLQVYGLKITRFGDCSNAPYPTQKILNDTIKTHKFYLSFENVLHCKDYITEKLFVRALNNGAVPVVYGAKKEDYKALAPLGSFISAEDYKPRDLVKYLNYLDKNNTAYMEYFAWRRIPITKVTNYGQKTKLCQLCRVIHGINVDNNFNTHLKPHISKYGFPTQGRTVNSFKQWLVNNENKECFVLE